jgi:phosphopantetheinyl transferase
MEDINCKSNKGTQSLKESFFTEQSTNEQTLFQSQESVLTSFQKNYLWD